MANEITIAATISSVNGELTVARTGPTQLQVDQAKSEYHVVFQNIGTVAETIDTSAVTTEGYCLMKNLDATNFITYGPDSTGQVDFGKLKAGEVALFRIKDAITLKATADTAACDVILHLWND